MSKLKEYFAKQRKYKKHEKDLKKRIKQEEKEIDKEYKELYGKKNHDNISNKLARGMASFFDILWPDDEEEIDREYEQYLTEEEKKSIEDLKKEEKGIIRKAILSYIGIGVAVVAIVLLSSYLAQSHYKKVVAPMIKEYFKNHYNEEIKLESNSLICYEARNDEGQTKEECTDLLVSTTNTNNHVITINDKYAGDDKRTDSFVKSYEATFEQAFEEIGIVAQETSLSYQDFYHDYNEHLDYINVLPIDVKYDDLYKSKKLTVVGRVLYQKEVDLEYVQTYLKSFGANSRIFFIKVSSGFPSKLSMVSKDEIFSAEITNSKSLENFITYYELDRELNSVNSCEKTDVTTHGISESKYNSQYDEAKYKYEDAKYFTIDFDRDQHWYGDEEKEHVEKKQFFLLKYTNGYFPKQYILFNGSKGSYSELDKDKYPTFEVLHVGNETYIISDSSFGIANKTEKKRGILCNLGLC